MSRHGDVKLSAGRMICWKHPTEAYPMACVLQDNRAVADTY